MSTDRSIRVFFKDGSDLSLAFPQQPGNPHLLAKRVQTALDANQLAVEVDGELLVIPVGSIKYMLVKPCPEMLPETVIVGGKIVAET